MSEQDPKPLVDADQAKGVKVNAGAIAKPFRDEIKKKVETMKQDGIGKFVVEWFSRSITIAPEAPEKAIWRPFEWQDVIWSMLLFVTNAEAPLLVGLLANKDPAARKYAEWTGKACRADGLRYELRTLDDPIEVEAALIDANDDPRVHGIIVYYPIFGQEESFSGESQDDYLRDTISHKCDVEGLCHLYRTNLYRNVRYLDYPANNQKCLLPCTALSVVKIIEACPQTYDMTKPIGRKLEGKTITVINRSEIVGRPLAAMLANDGAHVYSVDINSIYMFRDGRLHPCGDDVTPESCVRKVRG